MILNLQKRIYTTLVYENTDGQGSFGAQQVISTAVKEVSSVYAADLDGDGDMDVLSASLDDNKIAWYENTDGLGGFGSQQVISTAARGLSSVYAVDLDGDGDLDVLSASQDDNKIAWYENSDGLGSFLGAQQVITSAARGAFFVYAADLDGDGDQDVLSASFSDNKIAWYENTDGQGGFGALQIISAVAGTAVFVHAADLDGDGDQDVLSASFNGDKIAWYRNSSVTSVSTSVQTVKEFELSPNYPNPFNPETRINFTIPQISPVTLTIYDILGKKVRTLLNETKPAGSHDVSWNGKDDRGQLLASGLYVYKLQAGTFTTVKKMMFLK